MILSEITKQVNKEIIKKKGKNRKKKKKTGLVTNLM